MATVSLRKGTPIQRTREQVGQWLRRRDWRRFAIFWVSLIGIVKGYSYSGIIVANDLPPGFGQHGLGASIPIEVWGSLWMVTGVAGVIVAARGGKGDVVLAGLVFLHLLWTGGYVIGWIQFHDLSWRGVSTYAGITGLLISELMAHIFARPPVTKRPAV